MRRLARLLLVSAIVILSGCGPSLTSLNNLAARGSIDENAPVKAQVQVKIAAPPPKVWAILIDTPSWPKWNPAIESVTAAGPLANAEQFSWKTGGINIHSQVQLFEPEHRLSWTGTAWTSKAIHAWALTPEADDRTLLTVKESMEGPGIAWIFPSDKLAAADKEWLMALKRAAESSR